LKKNPELVLTPIVVSHWPIDDLVSFGRAIAGAIHQVGEPVLIVASTDMSHFVSATEAEQEDGKALRAIANLDPTELCETVLGEGISMCGVMPTAVGLAAATSLGARQSVLVDYTHSGLVTGDNSSVVAYAGAIIT
jgi:MEMO1 family protein